MRVYVVLLLLALVANGQAHLLDRLTARLFNVGDDQPWFCHDADCPSFQVDKRVGDYYEIRSYPETKWAGIIEAGSKFELAISKGFASLYRYFDGANDQSKKMPMTEPVLSRIKPVNGFRTSETNYTISFYLLDEFQKQDPPKPTNNAIKVFTLPASKIYMTAFGGFATEGAILKTAAGLLEHLKKDKLPVQEDYFYFASYDPPTRIKERHNEVWFLSKAPGS
ncbi:hypothetical protein WJX72_001947 [[Myrmecia] bisecta]|uniref:Heme-binding protein 2 n=1 Tax=[Myrmecia] bisecta TaxID=41462 RepID=A0AAW1PNJ3_9CHLO